MNPEDDRIIYLEERREAILSLLENDGVVRITDLSERFQVSSATIRKDIRSLEREGLLRRTHGGAIKPQQNHELKLEVAVTSAHDEKVRIGKAAAQMVHDSDILFIQAGTTCREFARALKGKRGLTLFLSDFEIAMDAERILPDSEIIFIGGPVRTGYHYTHGPEAIRQLLNYHVPTAFMSTNAFTFDIGFSTHRLEQANWLQAQLKMADRNIMLLDSSKFGIQAPFGSFGLDDIDCLITDTLMDADIRDRIHEKAPGLDIVFA
ncbi:MAG: DeoR/GlpR family DNA-binding transcription regulator [Collinsella sp.]|nr:DeoR/GlpR family DNA-binding transcription regulator [Collinsella sp.]